MIFYSEADKLPVISAFGTCSGKGCIKFITNIICIDSEIKARHLVLRAFLTVWGLQKKTIFQDLENVFSARTVVF